MFFIGRVIFTMMFWVVISRWTYAEISQASPMLQSSVDQILEYASIPTHDQWDFAKMQQMAEQLGESFKSKEAFAIDD